MRKVLPAGRRGFIPAPVMIGLAVILFITAATIYVNSNLIRKAHEQPVDKTATPADVVMDVPTNWKTYLNTTDGYSVRYPATWNAAELTGSQRGQTRVNFGPGVTEYHTEDTNTKVWIMTQIPGDQGSIIKSANDYVQLSLNGEKTSPFFLDGNITSITVGGAQGYKLRTSSNITGTIHVNVSVGVDHNGLIYLFGGRESPEFDQILSTFKFTQ